MACNCKKKNKGNSPTQQMSNDITVKNFTYNAEDFVHKFYIGESGIVIGEVTGINYNVRNTNQRMLVHINDLNDNFSDEPIIIVESDEQLELGEMI